MTESDRPAVRDGRQGTDETPEPAWAPRLGADEALRLLLAGNRRYVAESMSGPNRTATRRLEVSSQQYPFAAILGCADSRVPVEVVFDVGIGDLFVIRVAGNVVDHVVMGSVEFAVELLSVPLVVVLGHTRCGAVTAAVDALVHRRQLPGNLPDVVQPIASAVFRAQEGVGDLVRKATIANIRLAVERLSGAGVVYEPRVRSGAVRVVGALYDLDTGTVQINP